MARRRRRRERRDVAEHRPATPEKREKRSEDRRRQMLFEADQRSLRRRRTFVGALGFIPLVGALGCGAGLQLACQVPQEWWLAIWAALFGSFLGITIRMFLARRRFLRGAASG